MAMSPPPGPDQPEQNPGSGPDWNQMKGKLTAARGADRLILIAGLVFFIDSFLPWYGFSISGFGASISGWNSGGLAILAILLALLATAFAATRVLGLKVNLGSANDGTVYLALGGGAFVFALLRFITQTRLTKYGLFIAIIAGGVLAFGGWQKFNASKS